MKSLLLLATIFLTLNALAEVKPDGSLVATQCGANIAESPAAGNKFPLEICTWNVNGVDPAALVDNRPIFSVKTTSGMTFYLVLGRFQKDETVWVWQAYKLNTYKSGSYYYMSHGIDLIVPMLELTQILSPEDSGYPQLIGPMIQVQLEPVFQTQSPQ